MGTSTRAKKFRTPDLSVLSKKLGRKEPLRKYLWERQRDWVLSLEQSGLGDTRRLTFASNVAKSGRVTGGVLTEREGVPENCEGFGVTEFRKESKTGCVLVIGEKRKAEKSV